MKAKTIKKQYISFGTYFGSGYYESEEDIINYMYAINYTMSSKNDDGDIIVIPKEGITEEEEKEAQKFFEEQDEIEDLMKDLKKADELHGNISSDLRIAKQKINEKIKNPWIWIAPLILLALSTIIFSKINMTLCGILDTFSLVVLLVHLIIRCVNNAKLKKAWYEYITEAEKQLVDIQAPIDAIIGRINKIIENRKGLLK